MATTKKGQAEKMQFLRAILRDICSDEELRGYWKKVLVWVLHHGESEPSEGDLEFVARVLRDVCESEEKSEFAKRFREMGVEERKDANATSSFGMAQVYVASGERWDHLAELVEA